MEAEASGQGLAQSASTFQQLPKPRTEKAAHLTASSGAGPVNGMRGPQPELKEVYHTLSVLKHKLDDIESSR